MESDRLLRLPRYLFIIAIGLIAVGFLIYFTAILTNNSLLLLLVQIYNDYVLGSVSLVAGAFLASLFGLYSSVLYLDYQQRQERIRIMRGFYYEVLDIKAAAGNISQTDERACFVSLISNPPIYGKNGLFYVLRKELFALDDEVVKPLLQLYSDLVKLCNLQMALKEGGKHMTLDPRITCDLAAKVTRQLDGAQSLLSIKLKENM